MATSSGGKDGEESKGRLEVFDGSNPSGYRKWRRRAELYLLALPSNYSKERWGPKLLEFIQGEAEEALEDLSIEKVTAETGYKDIFSILDDKYKELQQESLHRGLKEYFYQVMIKPGESYRNFMVRIDTAHRKLVEHGITLPEEVQGWFLMRKLGLDQSSESMVLTATSGSLKKSEVTKAIKAIFPQGKGGHIKKSDVFVADEFDQESGMPAVDMDVQIDDVEQAEVQEIFEVVAEQLQQNSDYEEEEAIDVFETYRDIKRKVQDKKTSRGFKGSAKGQSKGQMGSAWQLQGSIKGRIDIIKSKTRCHVCKQLGHWRRECPVRNQSRGRSTAASSATGSSTANDVRYTDVLSFDEYQVLKPVAEVLVSEKQGKQRSAAKIKGKSLDEWKLGEDGRELWRIHRKARIGLFTPKGVPGCPVEEDRLQGSRRTEVNFVDGQTETITDLVGGTSANKSLSKLWTGVTRFSLKPQQEQVAHEQSVYDIHLTDTVVTEFEQQVLSQGAWAGSWR